MNRKQYDSKEMEYIRYIDELGRIAIPKEIRRELRVKVGDKFQIKLEKDKTVSCKIERSDSI